MKINYINTNLTNRGNCTIPGELTQLGYPVFDEIKKPKAKEVIVCKGRVDISLTIQQWNFTISNNFKTSFPITIRLIKNIP